MFVFVTHWRTPSRMAHRHEVTERLVDRDRFHLLFEAVRECLTGRSVSQFYGVHDDLFPVVQQSLDYERGQETENCSVLQRQRTVLQTIYLVDYFESPRGSTAEEVATSLDIMRSTLLHHLRAGQRKLLDAYLDGRRQPSKRE
jgi:predicted DNA binding protein